MVARISAHIPKWQRTAGSGHPTLAITKDLFETAHKVNSLEAFEVTFACKRTQSLFVAEAVAITD